MEQKIAELDKEVAEREAAGKFKSAICIFAGNTFLHGITLPVLHGANMSLSRRQFIQASGLHFVQALFP